MITDNTTCLVDGWLRIERKFICKIMEKRGEEGNGSQGRRKEEDGKRNEKNCFWEQI